MPRDRLPDDLAPPVGQRLEMMTRDRRKVPVTVTSATDDAVRIEANHPLAGHALTFDLELVKIA